VWELVTFLRGDDRPQCFEVLLLDEATGAEFACGVVEIVLARGG